MTTAATILIRAAIALSFASGATARAQDAILAAEESPSEVPAHVFFGEAWAGYDHVEGLPAGREDLDRVRTPPWESREYELDDDCMEASVFHGPPR